MIFDYGSRIEIRHCTSVRVFLHVFSFLFPSIPLEKRGARSPIWPSIASERKIDVYPVRVLCVKFWQSGISSDALVVKKNSWNIRRMEYRNSTFSEPLYPDVAKFFRVLKITLFYFIWFFYLPLFYEFRNKYLLYYFFINIIKMNVIWMKFVLNME